MVNNDIKKINTFLGEYLLVAMINVGAPTITPIAYIDIKFPAVGIEIFKSFAKSSKTPIIENSVIPMAKPPIAKASKLFFTIYSSILRIILSANRRDLQKK